MKDGMEEGSALAHHPKAKAGKEGKHEGGASEGKKLHHIEVHPSHSGGHIAIHHHSPDGVGMAEGAPMHAVAPGGMDDHLAEHMPGGPAEAAPEPEGGAEEMAGGAAAGGGGGGAPGM